MACMGLKCPVCGAAMTRAELDALARGQARALWRCTECGYTLEAGGGTP